MIEISSHHKLVQPIYELFPCSSGRIERGDARVYRFLYVSANIGDRGTIRGRRVAEDEAKKDLSCRKVFSC